ncbi:hypothetical protein QBC47DRAFT_151911 [Echria macrotheca]|uniref:Uncharacterized protein n=1 Tax=Echria macrotheca TaxID=438768 RepID=A0AAJ0F5Q9_9PEZI|nr:hypothetical protein QBC47DRAFT_151911 [Echria macrotheca]
MMWLCVGGLARSNKNGEEQLYCVVLGIEKGLEHVQLRMHYFIMVRCAASEYVRPYGRKVYERISAGYLPGRYILETNKDAAIC